MDNPSDAEILSKFRDPVTKEAGFRMLMEKYQERLYWQIRRMVIDHEDTNDILQNVFIKVWKNLARFKEQSQLFTWLYRITANESLTFIKKKNKRQAFPLQNSEIDFSEMLKADHYFDGDEIQSRLQTAIHMLPNKQKQVFNLRYYDEMNYEEMSKLLGTSVGALKASYHHAVKKIESFFKEH